MGIFKKDTSKKDAPKEKQQVKAVAEKPQEKKKAEKPKKEKRVLKTGSIAYRVLRRPLISEKATFLNAIGKYVFLVDRRASKQHVREAIAEVYGVTPTAVNIVRLSGKERRYGQSHGKTSDTKKAIITLPEGATITVHEGV